MRGGLWTGEILMAYETSNSNPAGMQAVSNASVSHGSDPQSTTMASGMADLELHFREALVLWLRWNEAYEKATTHLFAAGQSAEKLEDFMDSMDQLRRQA